MPTVFLRYLDLAICCVIFSISSGTSWIAIQEIINQEGAKDIPLAMIESGRGKHSVLSNNRCVGVFETELTTIKSTVIALNGELVLSFGATRSRAEVKGNFNFNPLGQLSETEMMIELDPITIHVTTTGANPVAVKVEAKSKEIKKKFDLSAPGPITLKRVAQDRYELRGPNIAPNLNLIGLLPTGILGLKVSNTPTGAEDVDSCNSQNLQSLNLAALLASVTSLRSNYEQMLGIQNQGQNNEELLGSEDD